MGKNNNFRHGGGGASQMGRMGKSKGAIERRNAGRHEKFRAKKMHKVQSREGKRIKKERVGNDSAATTALMVVIGQVMVGFAFVVLAIFALRYILSD